MDLSEFFDRPQFSIPADQKSALMVATLNDLTHHHRERCPEYRRILDGVYRGRIAGEQLADVPWLPVSLFKTHRLASVPQQEVFKTLTSSGTTGQRVSRIVLDRDTARRQSAALAAIMGHLLGKARLPMLIVDSESVLRNRDQFSARAAGIVGMMTFGRKHRFVLDANMQLDHEGLARFLSEHGDRPFLVFGFTFMIWRYLYGAVDDERYDLSNGTLVHGGGWKKLRQDAIDNAQFKARLLARLKLPRVYDYYGMVEQVGSVFLEGEDGFLYTPNFADVIVRDPHSWEEAPLGEPGVIEVLSVLPTSYPGHALLTEDLGVVHGVDDSACGRLGKRFTVVGRVEKAELRGCSDTHAFGAGS